MRFIFPPAIILLTPILIPCYTKIKRGRRKQLGKEEKKTEIEIAESAWKAFIWTVIFVVLFLVLVYVI